MQKRYRPNDFVKYHEGRGHHGARFELLRQGKAARLEMIDEQSAAAAHGVGSNGALMRQQAKADKTLGEFTVGLLAQQFFACLAPPEIHSADLEKFTRRTAKKLNQ